MHVAEGVSGNDVQDPVVVKIGQGKAKRPAAAVYVAKQCLVEAGLQNPSLRNPRRLDQCGKNAYVQDMKPALE